MSRDQVDTLSSIVINQIVNSSYERLQKFQLAYKRTATSNALLLTGITQYGKTDSQYLPPTIFDYYERSGYDFTTQPILYQATRTINSETKKGELNKYVKLVDMNGDALVDQLVGFKNSNKFMVYLNNGANFACRTSGTNPSTCNGIEWNDPLSCTGNQECVGRIENWKTDNNVRHQYLSLMDMNGDFLPDRFVHYKDGAGNHFLKIAFNTGSRWGAPVLWKDPYQGDWAGHLDIKRGLIDMNGDGLPDRIIGSKDINGFRVYLNKGDGFSSTEEIWIDPLSIMDSDNSGIGLLSSGDQFGYVSSFIRDMNGDGLPDRVYKASRHIDINGEEKLGIGFSVHININGYQWHQPQPVPERPGYFYCDGMNNLFLVDPVLATSARGFLTPLHDLIDFNGDGFVDRVEGIPYESGNSQSGKFKVYFYNGLVPGEVNDHFNSTGDTFTDRINLTADRGHINHSDDDGLRTFFQDINGDGYPDRVSSISINGQSDNKRYEVYYLNVNHLNFSEWPGMDISQPINALKTVDNGLGRKMSIEYLPTSWPSNGGVATQAPTSLHRFLPFNMYVAFKIAVTDPTLTMVDSEWNNVNWLRYKGKRLTVFNYKGGNFFVRYAQRAPNTDTGDNLIKKYTSTFNGFQEVKKITYSRPNRVLSTITTIYHQAKGDVPLNQNSALYDFIYNHFHLSGRVFRTLTTSSSEIRAEETNTWEINAPTSDLFSCTDPQAYSPDQTVCRPNLKKSEKFTLERAATLNRPTVTEYGYDDYGNILSESISDGQTTLLTKTKTYYPHGNFASEHFIRNRPQFEEVTSDGTLHKKREFRYDTNGNVRYEIVSIKNGQTQTIERTYKSDGRLDTFTDIDGVKKTYGYAGNDDIKPLYEAIQNDSGQNLTIERAYNRLNGSVLKEINPQGVGKRVVYDDFGRPLEEYVIDTQAREKLSRRYEYEILPPQAIDQWSLRLFRAKIYEPRDDYPETSTQPSKIAYSNDSGQVLQECVLAENGRYRLAQKRIQDVGLKEIATEPVYTPVGDQCTFISQIVLTVPRVVVQKDITGRITLEDRPLGDTDSPMGDIQYEYSVDSFRRLVKTIHLFGNVNGAPVGQTKKEMYDTFGRLVEVAEPDNSRLTYTYYPTGDLKTVSANGKLLTTIEYDMMGRKEKMIDGDMGTWTYLYNPQNGKLEDQIDNKGQRIHITYDKLTRIKQKDFFKQDGSKERYEVYTYDQGESGFDVKLGELFSVEEFDGSGSRFIKTRYGYDGLYRHQSKIGRDIAGFAEFTQSFSHDFRGQLRSVIYPFNENIHQFYSRTGSLEKVCADSSCTNTYYSIDPSNGINEFGQITKESFGNGVFTDYSYYPKSHRLQSKKTGLASSTYSNRAYIYDLFSNLKSIQDPLNLPGSQALQSVTYDNLNQMKAFQPVGNSEQSLEYDQLGNVQKNTANYGNDFYEYTSSRPHAVTKIGSETFSYDDNGNMTGDAYRSMSYNVHNQLAHVEMQNGVKVDFGYDYSGNRIFKKSLRTDPLGQVHEGNTYYLGDSLEIKDRIVYFNIYAGSRRIATKALGKMEELAAFGGSNLQDNGIEIPFNLVHVAPFLFLAVNLFVVASFRPVRWRNGLKSRAPPSFCPAFVFNNILYAKNLWGTYTLILEEAGNQFCYQRHKKLASLFVAVILVIHYPLNSIAASGDADSSNSNSKYFFYLQGDHLGSSHIITEGNTENRHEGILYKLCELVQRFEYDPFGKEQYVLNPNLSITPRYTDQTADYETGLIYYKARYYNPRLGCFIQPDTFVPDVKRTKGFNRYTYGYNNPLKYLDPSGHISLDFNSIIGGIGSAISSIFSISNKIISSPTAGSAEMNYADNYSADLGEDEDQIDTILNMIKLSKDEGYHELLTENNEEFNLEEMLAKTILQSEGQLCVDAANSYSEIARELNANIGPKGHLKDESNGIVDSIFNEGTYIYWALGGAVWGAGVGYFVGITKLGIPGGIVGAMGGMMLGAGTGSAAWLQGMSFADDGLWSFWIFGAPPKGH